MKILLTGASGLVGRHAKNLLSEKGCEIYCLVRQQPLFNNEIFWDPDEGKIELSFLEGMDAIIHLSGESIAQRWNEQIKERLSSSRIQSTDLLVQSVLRLSRKPRIFLCASAVGIYGSNPGYSCTEDSATGRDFLASLCTQWEGKALSLGDAGIRVCCMRFGTLLSPEGGMLQRLLPLFRFGLGGPIGDGSMHLSWISIEDVCRAIYHTLHTELSGPINFVSPAPETNYYFAKKLAHALHRPCFLKVPPLFLRLLYGEMADEVLLSSILAVPEKLLASGFQFQHPVLDIYFEDILRW